MAPTMNCVPTAEFNKMDTSQQAQKRSGVFPTAGGGNSSTARISSAFNKPSSSSNSNSNSSSKIFVNSNQRGNPVLNYIRNVGWEFREGAVIKGTGAPASSAGAGTTSSSTPNGAAGSTTATSGNLAVGSNLNSGYASSSGLIVDYEVGQTTGVLFLSLKYNRLYPEHIYTRIKQVGQRYKLRVVLVMVDIDDPQQSLRDLTRVTVFNSFTLLLAWSPQEAARYLETIKAYEHKSADSLKEKIDQQYFPQLTDALTQVKTVSKTDVITLSSELGSLRNIMLANTDDFVKCPGFGDMKAAKLYAAFNEPFLKK